MQRTHKLLSLLGLAQRAGKLASGEAKALQAVQQGKACLVIMAKDASDNTRKKFTDKCQYYQVPFLQEFDRTTLGRSTGHDERVVIAVVDQGFADAMLKSVDT